MLSLSDGLLSDGDEDSRQALSLIIKSYYYWLRCHSCEESILFLFSETAREGGIGLGMETAQSEARMLEFICGSRVLGEDLEPIYSKSSFAHI
jgi:hypothetical protein